MTGEDPFSLFKRSQGTGWDTLTASEQEAVLKWRNDVHVSGKRCFIYPRSDITRGYEDIAIPWVNEYEEEAEEGQASGLEPHLRLQMRTGRNEQPPEDWMYCKENIVYSEAEVYKSLELQDPKECVSCESDCIGDAVDAQFCSCKGDKGEFAYTSEGRLTDKYLEALVNPMQVYWCPNREACKWLRGRKRQCKGHSWRPFIKECGVKCGCGTLCHNRTVQQGIKIHLQVFFRRGVGWALQTLEAIPKGSFVLEFVGEILTNKEQDERNQERIRDGKDIVAVQLDACPLTESIVDDHHALCLDASRMGNVARFINHQCGDANLIDAPVEYDTPNLNYYHVAFFAQRDIAAMEELTWDYGLDFQDTSTDLPSFMCVCGSVFCRGANDKGSRKRKRKVKAREQEQGLAEGTDRAIGTTTDNEESGGTGSNKPKRKAATDGHQQISSSGSNSASAT